MTLRSSRPVFWRVTMSAVFFIFESTRRLGAWRPTPGGFDDEQAGAYFYSAAPFFQRLLRTDLTARAFRHASTVIPCHERFGVPCCVVRYCEEKPADNRKWLSGGEGKCKCNATRCTCGGAGPIQRNHSRVINTSNVQFIKTTEYRLNAALFSWETNGIHVTRVAIIKNRTPDEICQFEKRVLMKWWNSDEMMKFSNFGFLMKWWNDEILLMK